MKLPTMFYFTSLVIISFAVNGILAGSAPRLPDSPYPASKLPGQIYLFYLNVSLDEQLLAQSLSGIVARNIDTSGSFLYFVDSSSDQFWLDEISKQPGLKINRFFSTDLKGLVSTFKSQDIIRGYILFDIPNSIDAAVSLSGIHQSIIVTSNTLQIAQQLGIPQTLNVIGSNIENIFQEYKPQFNHRLLFHQITATEYGRYLSDYAIFSKAFAISDQLLSSPFCVNVLKSMYLTSAVLGWSKSEGDFAGTASDWSKYVHAADYSKNLPILSNFDNSNIIKSRARDFDSKSLPSTAHYVTFVMTDGDNLQWLQNGFLGPNWYGSKFRGSVPLGWTISPALVEIAPTIANYILQNASDKDDFIAAPSGIGYILPSHYPQGNYPDLQLFSNLTASFMNKFHMSVLNIIDDQYDPIALKTLLKPEQIDAVFLYLGNGYTQGILGNVYWESENKFGTGPRWILASGMGPHSVNPQQLSQILNSASKDPKSKDAWDIVPVHVWSMNVEDVYNTVKMLNPDVIVVTPTEFVSLFKSYHPN